MTRRCLGAVLVVLLLFGSVSLFASTQQTLTTDCVRSAITQPDGTTVRLPAVFVEKVSGDYAFVRDTCSTSPQIALSVYLKTFIVQNGWTLNITGNMATVGAYRVLVAQDISVYTDSDGKEFSFPIPIKDEDDWPYTKDAKVGISIMDSDPTLPPVPESEPVESEPLTPEEGTIAYVKLNGDEVDITGKLVTAVYYDNGLVSFFYIQEPFTGGNGIKVVPQVSVPIEPGNIVAIKGSLISGELSGEAYISAARIKCTGSMKRPGPAGLIGRSTAGGEFGEQPALYLDTSNVSASGGLSAVGTRVRVWGIVLDTTTENGHAVCWIDDGSALATTSHTGLKVVYWNLSDAPGSQTYVEGVTGVLGAEMADGKPVPVVRVPDSSMDGIPNCVKYVTPGGVDIGSWTNCYSSIQSAIEAASAENQMCEVWVAAGTYSEYINILGDVAVYGGFAGGESLREERNWALHETILDGTVLQYGDFVAFQGQSRETRLDGFIIQYSKGAGISCGEGYCVIANNTIRNNSGNGIYIYDGYQLVYSNKISGNTAGFGGGVYCSGGGAQLLNNDVSSNVASQNGGGVYIYGSSAQILSNSITDNTASSSSGGGICCYGSNPIISGNTIQNNTSADYGGGIYFTSEPNKITRVSSNVIIENTCATAGAGIYCDDSACDIINNTIAWNGSSGVGDGIFLTGTSYTYKVINNIVANNQGAGIKGVSGINITLNNNDSFGHGQYNYVDVGTVDNSNISVDPSFEITPAHNIHLQETSQCINVGLNSVVNVGDVDIDGQARIMDNTVDIGADEVTGCISHIVILSPALSWAFTGSVVCLNAALTFPVGGVRVNFSIDAGQIVSISPGGYIDPGGQSGYGFSDSNGVVNIYITRADVGDVNVTAYVSQCGGISEDEAKVCFYDPNTPSDVVFVVDRSGSMQGHEASASIESFVRDVYSAIPDPRFGAVMFNEGTPISRSISLFTGEDAVDAFCEWVNSFSAEGETDANIDALNLAAQDLEDNLSTSRRRFVVYVTDAGEEACDSATERLQLVQRLDALTATKGSGVFVSLWEDPYSIPRPLYDFYSFGFTNDPAYLSLAVNGAFDSIDWNNQNPASRYLFDNLKNRVLYGL
ncbi:right-handed parallel beta-helix repeat-containing protein [bacterium]|nr:right-handed parallel beta-helix repeat-containing protein [bacterium]